MTYDLNRFLKAQEISYNNAFSEIKLGKKTSHWIWFVFPQIKGLGFSDIAKLYAIQDLDEAKAYLNHPILGVRLIGITNELLKHEGLTANSIFGNPDDLKLHSSMTLFSQVDDSEEKLFMKVIDKFFNGYLDNKTLKIIGK
jgi:uncharacterized protein (DUF1810 family)